MMNSKISCKTIALLGAICVPVLAMADSEDFAHDNQVAISIDQAMSIALKEVPGSVLGTELEKEDKKLVWEIEILTDEKKTFEVEVDAETGDVLEVEEDD